MDRTALKSGGSTGDLSAYVFSLAGGQWSVAYAANTGWQRLNSKLASELEDLAFGDFDGDGRTDVARSSGSKWQVSWGGATPWTLLREEQGPIAKGTLIGDFDGDLRADVLRHSRLPGLSKSFCGSSPGSLARYKLSSGGSGPLFEWSLYDMD